jgi:hypothetical protein
MVSSQEPPEDGAELDRPPFLYEIRVKGRLSSEQWTSWFDDLAVSTAKGESILRGSVPDHAALYGLLARLRDLAIPLVGVRVLDEEAQRRLSRQSRRYDLLMNLLLVALYLMLLGGLIAVTVWVAPVLTPALAMALLFALVGGLAHAIWLWGAHPAWRWISYAAWSGAIVSFLILIPVSGMLPRALSIAITLFLAASGLFYVLYAVRRADQNARERMTGEGEEHPPCLPPAAAGGSEPG